MTSPFQTYKEPENLEGDRYKPIEHVGATLIVRVNEFKPRVITENSPEGGPAVIVDLVDLETSEKYQNVLWMSGALVDGLKPYVGPIPLVVKINKKQSKSGRSYPIAVEAEDQVPRATAWVQANGDPFAPKFANTATPSSDAPPF